MYQKIRIVIIVLFAAFQVNGQDASEALADEFQLIANKLDSSEQVHLHAMIHSYSNKTGTLLYQTSAEVYRYKGNHCTVLGEVEIIETSDYSVQINHEEKKVLILKKSKVQPKKGKSKPLSLDLSGLSDYWMEEDTIAADTKVSLVSNGENEKQFKVESSNQKITIALNPTARSINYLEILSGNDAQNEIRTRVEYDVFTTTENTKDKFDLSNYFQETGAQQYILKGRISGYKLFTEE